MRPNKGQRKQEGNLSVLLKIKTLLSLHHYVYLKRILGIVAQRITEEEKQPMERTSERQSGEEKDSKGGLDEAGETGENGGAVVLGFPMTVCLAAPHVPH